MTKKPKRRSEPSFWIYQDSDQNIYTELLLDSENKPLKSGLIAQDPRDFTFEAEMQIVGCSISSVGKSYFKVRDISHGRKFFDITFKPSPPPLRSMMSCYNSTFFMIGPSEAERIIMRGAVNGLTISGIWFVTKRVRDYRIQLLEEKEVESEEGDSDES